MYSHSFRSLLTTGAKVLGIFVLKERKFHRKESSKERKFLERSLPRNESSTIKSNLIVSVTCIARLHESECSKKQMFHGRKVLTVD